MYIVVRHIAEGNREVQRTEGSVKFLTSMAARKHKNYLEEKTLTGEDWYLRDIEEWDGVTRCEVVQPMPSDMDDTESLYEWYSVERAMEES